jgi:DNA-directed RNA polymerase specialized sigma24 family protein
MYRVLKNLFIDEERRRARQEALYENLAWEAELDTAPATTMLAREMIDLVPERYRDVLLIDKLIKCCIICIWPNVSFS